MRKLPWWVFVVGLLTFAPAILAANSAQTAFEHAMTRYEQGNLEQAIPFFHQAIALDPLLAEGPRISRTNAVEARALGGGARAYEYRVRADARGEKTALLD